MHLISDVNYFSWKSAIFRVASCELRVASCELQAASCESLDSAETFGQHKTSNNLALNDGSKVRVN